MNTLGGILIHINWTSFQQIVVYLTIFTTTGYGLARQLQIGQRTIRLLAQLVQIRTADRSPLSPRKVQESHQEFSEVQWVKQGGMVGSRWTVSSVNPYDRPIIWGFTISKKPGVYPGSGARDSLRGTDQTKLQWTTFTKRHNRWTIKLTNKTNKLVPCDDVTHDRPGRETVRRQTKGRRATATTMTGNTDKKFM